MYIHSQLFYILTHNTGTIGFYNHTFIHFFISYQRVERTCWAHILLTGTLTFKVSAAGICMLCCHRNLFLKQGKICTSIITGLAQKLLSLQNLALQSLNLCLIPPCTPAQNSPGLLLLKGCFHTSLIPYLARGGTRTSAVHLHMPAQYGPGLVIAPTRQRHN
jgi:hypothetical protein